MPLLNNKAARAARNSRSPGQHLTTGEVARLCDVAPRTVSKWFDSGRLGGFRLPESKDRRIPRAVLLRFLVEYGMHEAAARLGHAPRVLVVGGAGLAAGLGELVQGVTHAEGAFTAGAAFANRCTTSVVLDASELGREVTVRLARAVVARARPPVVVVVAPEDWGRDVWLSLMECGVTHVLGRPVSLEKLARLVEEDFA